MTKQLALAILLLILLLAVVVVAEILAMAWELMFLAIAPLAIIAGLVVHWVRNRKQQRRTM
jgi:hypothetical protein